MIFAGAVGLLIPCVLLIEASERESGHRVRIGLTEDRRRLPPRNGTTVSQMYIESWYIQVESNKRI